MKSGTLDTLTPVVVAADRVAALVDSTPIYKDYLNFVETSHSRARSGQLELSFDTLWLAITKTVTCVVSVVIRRDCSKKYMQR